MIKKIIIATIGLLAILFVFFLIRGSEDTWICVDGEWVKHGVPSAPMPTKPCEGKKIDDFQEKADLIKVFSPLPNQIIQSPFIVRGEARDADEL